MQRIEKFYALYYPKMYKEYNIFDFKNDQQRGWSPKKFLIFISNNSKKKRKKKELKLFSNKFSKIQLEYYPSAGLIWCKVT